MKKTEQDIELEIEKIKAQKNAQIKRLKEQKRKIQAANSAEARNQRTRILIAAGALLEGCIDGGAANMNMDMLASFVKQNKELIAKVVTTPEPRTMAEAGEALKDWERRGREAKRAQKEAAQGGGAA